MNPQLQLLLLILQDAGTIAAGQAGGKVAVVADIAGAALRIAQAGIAMYEQQTGQPIDVTLLKPIDLLTAADAPSTEAAPV